MKVLVDAEVHVDYGQTFVRSVEDVDCDLWDAYAGQATTNASDRHRRNATARKVHRTR